MCEDLNVRISDVVTVWVEDDYQFDEDEPSLNQVVRGNVERIGTNGVFRFEIGDLHDSNEEHLVQVLTGFRWNGNPNTEASTDSPVAYVASFYVHTIDAEIGQQYVFWLDSVLELTASPGPQGHMWLDSNPAVRYVQRRREQNQSATPPSRCCMASCSPVFVKR